MCYRQWCGQVTQFWFIAMILTAGIFIAGCSKEEKTVVKEEEAAKKVEAVKPAAPAVQAATRVKLETSMGDIAIELNPKAAPVTVRNFLEYTQEGFYDSTVFHRIIPGFMIQGGGFDTDLRQKESKATIINEASNGLKNVRGSIAMARQNAPDTATCQFFINHRDNKKLDYVAGASAGYTVFGKVVEGMEVVDEIAGVKTGVGKATVRLSNGMMKNVNWPDMPLKKVVIKSAKIISDK